MVSRLVTVTGHAPPGSAPQMQVALSYDQRTRSRLRVALAGGEELGLILARGAILRGGALLQAQDGRVIQVVAAAEALSHVESRDAFALARASYHLGNRHVLVQLGRTAHDDSCWLRFGHDHVLDEMLRGQGFTVSFVEAGFEPEAGAYAPHGHTGSHPNILAASHSHRHE